MTQSQCKRGENPNQDDPLMKDMTIRQEIDQLTIWAYMKKVKWGKKGLTTIVDIRYKPTVQNGKKSLNHIVRSTLLLCTEESTHFTEYSDYDCIKYFTYFLKINFIFNVNERAERPEIFLRQWRKAKIVVACHSKMFRSEILVACLEHQ